jgi:hypothetical protein
MKHEQVDELESLIEQALADLLRQSRVAKLVSRNQSPPSAKTLHLMAKAAVTVLEATEAPGE